MFATEKKIWIIDSFPVVEVTKFTGRLPFVAEHSGMALETSWSNQAKCFVKICNILQVTESLTVLEGSPRKGKKVVKVGISFHR